ncbi:Cysteine-rich and transmembrane domain-containing protein A [Hibiscus syriacus]|uniref:Rhodopsin n=1 Tax=Hibiscus syriacus TaxID=106335 RepID=A0A6A3D5T8_HIBSY|nr:Cysteine-rich and transmembrane domain-containing protein A [Hibiscus syriacus]
MGGGKEGESSDKGLFSQLAGYASGHNSHGYPPQGYLTQGYPPQGYPPQGYPPQGYPPQGYPSPFVVIIVVRGYGSHGHGVGGLLAGGAAAVAAVYGAHHMAHEAHHVGHGVSTAMDITGNSNMGNLSPETCLAEFSPSK